MNTYKPKPVDTSDVELDEMLVFLREAIAENAHEVWAEHRQREGWTYGPNRDDHKKQTPDMVPYFDLPEKEKQYDRDMAMRTLKLVRKLGYELRKTEETELSKAFEEKLRCRIPVYHCSQRLPNGEICGNVIYKYQVFCDRCGHKIDYYDFKS